MLFARGTRKSSLPASAPVRANLLCRANLSMGNAMPALAFEARPSLNATFGRINMAQSPDYAACVTQAENAVKGLKDPELKRIAFQKVLDDLLEGTGGGGRGRASPRARRGPAKKAGRRQAKTAKTKVARGGPRAYIRELIEEDFFKKPKTISNVKVELENRGHHIPLTSLSGPMQLLCQARKLRRTRTNEPGAKKTFVYPSCAPDP
jgi:hypothetical protein